MPEQHALLSASAAERWMNCPGSVAATKDIPDTGSVYAAEGTLAHSLCELKLRKLYGIPRPMKRSVYITRLTEIKADELYQPEMDDCSDTYVDHIRETVSAYQNKPIVVAEQHVDFSQFVPEGFGTSDCIILSETDIHVVDYKHGQGVPVSAVNNPQLKLYALGAVLTYSAFYPDIKTVTLHVVQPRLENISVWSLPLADLMEWAETVVRPAAERALSDDAPCIPGAAQCKFCKIRAFCRARAEAVNDLRRSPLFGKLPPTLTDDEVGAALTAGKDVADWLKKLQDYASHKLETGSAIPGFKLVEGRTSRVWDDQNAAFAAMRAAGVDDALLFERVPMSVAKLEKALNKKLFAQVAAPHITVSPGKPTMVPESDPRKPWSAAKADFADILKGE